MADRPSTSQEGQLIIFDLLASNQDWNVQTLFDFIVERFESINMDKSSFPSVLSVANLNNQRSKFNNTAYRQKMRLACSRYRQKHTCDKGVNLFDFFYPRPFQAIFPLPPSDKRRDEKRKIDALQKKARVGVEKLAPIVCSFPTDNERGRIRERKYG